MLIVELVAHMDAGDRATWRGEQDLRPLSNLGVSHAQRFCDAVGDARVDALFSSPALRCPQTLHPLADALTTTIGTLTDLRETGGFAPPTCWAGHMLPSYDPVDGPYAEGRLVRALKEVSAAIPEGRVVLCTHGDIVPAYLSYMTGAHGLNLPPPPAQRGYWYTLEIEPDGSMAAKLNEPIADFPL